MKISLFSVLFLISHFSQSQYLHSAYIKRMGSEKYNKIIALESDSLKKILRYTPLDLVISEEFKKEGYEINENKESEKILTALFCYQIISEREEVARPDRYYLGKLYQQLGDHQKAVFNYTEALKLPLELNFFLIDSEIKGKRGESKFALQDYYGAISDFTYAIETKDTTRWGDVIDDNKSEYYELRGRSFFLLNNITHSISDLDAAISIDKNYAEAYYMRGMILLSINKEKGCLDLSKAGELGYKKAYDSIEKECSH